MRLSTCLSSLLFLLVPALPLGFLPSTIFAQGFGFTSDYSVTSSSYSIRGMRSINSMPDGGHVMVARQVSGFEGIARTDVDGDMISAYSLPGLALIRHAPDKGFICAKLVFPGSIGSGDIQLIKLDSNFIPVWSQHCGTSQSETITELMIAPDGGAVVLGTSNNVPFLLKTDNLGNLAWMKKFSVSGYEQTPRFLIQTSDGQLLAGTNFTETAVGRYGTILIKIGMSGIPTWVRSVPGISTSTLVTQFEADGVVEYAPGRYIMTGSYYKYQDLGSSSYYEVDLGVYKISSGGSIVTTKKFYFPTGTVYGNYWSSLPVKYGDNEITMGVHDAFTGTIFHGRLVGMDTNLTVVREFKSTIPYVEFSSLEKGPKGIAGIYDDHGTGISFFNDKMDPALSCLTPVTELVGVNYSLPGFGLPSVNYSNVGSAVNVPLPSVPSVSFSMPRSCLSCTTIATGTGTSTVIAPGQVQFTSSVSGADSLWWDFGDGSTSTLPNPLHVYGPGTFHACLHFMNFTCNHEVICFDFSTCPVAGITGPDTICFGSSGTFSTVPGLGTTVTWFLDGLSVGTSPGLSLTPSAAGPHVLSVIHNNGVCSDTMSQSLYVSLTTGTVDFSVTYLGYTAYFADVTSPPASYWHWTFGDGFMTVGHNPTHVYAAPGLYNVCVNAGNACYAATTCKPIVVPCPVLVPGFSSSSTALNVTFTNTTTGYLGGATYSWDFGDGATSTSAGPSHTYLTGGTYFVCITVTDACLNTASWCDSVSVTCAPMGASFGSTSLGLTTNFTNFSFGSAPMIYSWDFGDGGTSALTDPVHTFPATGDYLTCLIVTDACADTMMHCDSLSFHCDALTAGFSYSNLFLNVSYTSSSSGTAPLAYSWDFGDGGTSTALAPSHAYAFGGTYWVCLTVSDTCGHSVNYCDSVLVNCPLPSAAFTSIPGGAIISFTNGSTGTGSLGSNWTFGDGGTSSLTNPSHTYPATGTYLACLSIYDVCGTDSVCHSVSVIVTEDGNLAETGSLILFPNPSGTGKITLQGEPQPGQLQIWITDMLGRTFMLSEASGSDLPDRIALSLDEFSPGVYTVEVKLPGNKVWKTKLILY